MKTTSVTLMKSTRRFRPGVAALALIALASLGSAQNAHAGPNNSQTSACPPTPSHPSPPPAQPAQVTVVNPVTVSGTVDIGHTVQIAGTVTTLNDALKIPFHLSVKQSIDNSAFLTQGNFFTVPAGMRLTIESVSARITVPAGHTPYASLSFSGGTDPSSSEDYFVFHPQGSSLFWGDVFVASQNLKIILDSTCPQINYSIWNSKQFGPLDYVLTVNGYLEEVP